MEHIEGTAEQLPHVQLLLGKTKRKPGKVVTVDRKHVSEIQSVKWQFNTQTRCFTGYYLKQTITLHYFIWIVLNQRVVPKGYSIDHKNRNYLDNRLENLRIATRRQQSLNKSKSKSATSQYFGVSVKRKKWRVQGDLDGHYVDIGTFETELMAAYVYDRWLITVPDFHEGFRNLNFPFLIDVYKSNPYTIPTRKTEKTSEYDGVCYVKSGDTWKAEIWLNGRNIHIGRRKVEIDAAKLRDAYIVKNNISRDLNFPEDYPEYHNKLQEDKKLKVTERDETTFFVHLSNTTTQFAIIDKSDYEKCSSCICYIEERNGYVQVRDRIHKAPMHLSRYLFDATIDDPLIDHINGNRLDYRRCNLRYLTHSQNSQNCKKREGCKSEYDGVRFATRENRWVAAYRDPISQTIESKYFECDQEYLAARYRDLLVLKHNKNPVHRLNFNWTVEDIEEWREKFNMSTKKQKVTVQTREQAERCALLRTILQARK